MRPKGLQGTLWEACWNDLGLQIEVLEPMLTHFLSLALQVASLDIIFNILFAFSPSLSTLRIPRIALILFVALPNLLRYQVLLHMVS